MIPHPHFRHFLLQDFHDPLQSPQIQELLTSLPGMLSIGGIFSQFPDLLTQRLGRQIFGIEENARLELHDGRAIIAPLIMLARTNDLWNTVEQARDDTILSPMMHIGQSLWEQLV